MHRRAIELCDGDTGGAQRDDLALVHDQHAAGVLENGGDVRGQELLAITQAGDERAAAETRADQQVGLLRTDHGDGIRAGHAAQRQPHGLFEIVLCLAEVIAFDQVRQHLGIGLAVEGMPLRFKFDAQLGVVLDDAVMHHRQHAGAVGVRVRVRRRWGGHAWPSACGRCRASLDGGAPFLGRWLPGWQFSRRGGAHRGGRLR